MNDTPAIDWSRLEELRRMELDGMPGLAARLVGSYVENSTQRVADLQAATIAGDVDRVRRLAHSIKSTSSNVGANQLSQLGRALEHDAQAADFKPSQDDVDRISAEYRRVLVALSQRFDVVVPPE
jgi:HPt (histidine-containing phosphotransfer) domain-containing protein